VCDAIATLGGHTQMQSQDMTAPERRRSRCAVARDHDSRLIQRTRDTIVFARAIDLARRGIAISLQTMQR